MITTPNILLTVDNSAIDHALSRCRQCDNVADPLCFTHAAPLYVTGRFITVSNNDMELRADGGYGVHVHIFFHALFLTSNVYTTRSVFSMIWMFFIIHPKSQRMLLHHFTCPRSSLRTRTEMRKNLQEEINK